MTDFNFSKDNTIKDQSQMYFRSPSNWAKENLYYTDMYGHFTCDERYRVSRAGFDSYLFILTVKGSGTIKTKRGEYVCRPDQIALIDCNDQHSYWASDLWEFYYIHFNGQNSQAMISYILDNRGVVLPVSDTNLEIYFRKVAEGRFDNTLEDEIRISGQIYDIICQLAALSDQDKSSDKRQMTQQVLTYLNDNYYLKIKIEDLARNMGVSPSGLSHLFKEQTGFSVYDYILSRRCQRAKELLWSTDMPISEIAFQVGFQSESNFIKIFRQRNQITPSQYRRNSIKVL